MGAGRQDQRRQGGLGPANSMQKSMQYCPEYGPVFGVLTPQANTTVEPEMQILLEGSVLAARCTSPSADSRQRLLDYFDKLDATLASFDTAPLYVAGFACTGSSYLVGRAREEQKLAVLGAASGYAVISATQAIRRCLDVLGAKRLALVSPYPQWLSAAAKSYWHDCGYSTASVAGLPAELMDTRGIYQLTSVTVGKLLASLRTDNCDAVLLSGTGMPSLRTIAARIPAEGLPPVLSSNLCLAWTMLAEVDPQMATRAALTDFLAPDAAWRKRLASRVELY